MQKLQDSVFSIVKTANLSPAVFSFLQPNDDFGDKTPLGGILKDTKHGWLALGPKFCVVDLRTGLKVAARTFGASISSNTSVTCVVELPKPLTDNSDQLIISLQCDDIGMICILHINGSQILRCIQTDVVVTELAICDRIPDGPFTCFDGLVIAGTKRGEIFVFDLNRAGLTEALKYSSQGYEHLIQNEANPTNLSFLPLNAIQRLEEQRELALENDHHLAILLNENSMLEGQYIFRNPDGSVRMKAKRDHVRVTVLQYIPQLGSMAVGFNFGAFQIWNLMTLDLEFTSQVNVECLPVMHFGFQEPCDDPRAFCYLWVVFSVIDRHEEEEFPFAVMYSLTYQGKRMLSDTKCLYQDFSTAGIRFQIELGTLEEAPLLGGKCISCHSYSIKSTLGDEGEDSMLNICQLVWECWGEDINAPMQYGMLLFDLDQWYKDQMPATYSLESNTFMSATWCTDIASRGAVTLHARLDPATVCAYSHATRLEEHFYPNSLQYECVLLSTESAVWLRTVGIQRQIVCALEADGGAALLHPARLHAAAARAGLASPARSPHRDQDEQRRFLLSVALEARLSRFLKRCAHDWATGSHSGVGCTLTFLVDWAWKRAVELKENARELTAPLFVSSALPDRNVFRCLEHYVQQLTQLSGLMDAILTKCCNLVVPEALSEMEERHMGISCVALYFQVVQWFLRVGLLPERTENPNALSYPRQQLSDTYNKRRFKLNRLHDTSNPEDNGGTRSCSLLYIDQLIEQEFGGDKIHQMWIKNGSENYGLYPPPSLYSLLRLYLLPDIAEEHKHSLVLYLLVDYSMIYDDVRYEAVIRRLMQFPTMFGLSNTAIKATQAFWHLDHRDFDFALDQLQCLTGNTLHEWQHNVVLSSLLAQKKTQAALQYLHVRKPAPVQNFKDGDGNLNYSNRLNDHDKLEDWQSCCNLYLARGLVYEALDVIRMCAQNAQSCSDKAQVLNFFFKGCRNTGNLSKILQITLLPFEEEVFVKYLENCNESQTSDLLIMYYLKQARYLEAERYNNKLRESKPQRNKELSTSVESLIEVADRESARDALVEVACGALPSIASTVAHCAFDWSELETHVHAPKPMSVFVQAKSSKNTFTYKSSFIQDTIENASETWMNRPKMRKGLKRALNIEETPFICTPKLVRTRSVFTDQQTESTPPKRARLSLTGTPRTPKISTSYRVSEKLTHQMEQLLDMPEVQSPMPTYRERAETPHSILKIRRMDREEAPSPVDSRYLGDSDDDMLETASNHTHYSDSTNKHLRFTIPTASESGSTPSPTLVTTSEKSRLRDVQNIDEGDARGKETETSDFVREREMDVSTDSYTTTISHQINDTHPLESPPKKPATETNVKLTKTYKDTVRARHSLSISANSSLSEDPNTSIESIADIPITLINPRYSGERNKITSSQDEKHSEKSLSDIEGLEQSDSIQESERKLERSIREIEAKFERAERFSPNISHTREFESNLNMPSFSVQDIYFKDRFFEREASMSDEVRNREIVTSVEGDKVKMEGIKRDLKLEVPRTPKGRRGIRSIAESTPLFNRSRSVTPKRLDSPVITPMRTNRTVRSRSKTPELSPRSSPLAPIPEQPKLETESEPHEVKTTLSAPRPLRSRSRTPDRLDKVVKESPKLEVIKESPTKSSSTESPTSSPRRRSLRSKTPERIEKDVKELSTLDVIKESPTKASSTDLPTSSPTRRSLRSRTPERVEKDIPELEKLNAIAESPTKSSTIDSPTSSPTRRSLRSRSHTPELEIVPESTIKSSPRSLRGRSKTPEKLMSPKKEHSVRSKKSLSRIVLEANTFAKTKQTLESLETEIIESRSESVIECTPMKTLKPLPSLMDVTLSPIVNKSVLQSSTDSVLSGTPVKHTESDNSPDLKTLPAFTTLHETYFEKSVLKSYQSSLADSSGSIQEEKDMQIEKTEESSVAHKTSPAFTEINEIELNKSVLSSYDSIIAETSPSAPFEPTKEHMQEDKIMPNSLADFASMIETDFGKSVLRSHKSSVAESPDTSKDIQNASSLITNDSDVEMKETIESQDTAERKEKEKIVEIEREINEIEGDMSNDSERSDSDINMSGEDIAEEELEESDSSDQPSTPDTDEENSSLVISIESSDSDDEISEKETDSNQQANIEDIQLVVDEKLEPVKITEQVVTSELDDKFGIETMEGSSTDPPNQAQVSLMTDDNSALEMELSLVLNYSDDEIEPAIIKDTVELLKEPDASTKIQVTIEDISKTPKIKYQVSKNATECMDVVDTSASFIPTNEPEPTKNAGVNNLESSNKKAQDDIKEIEVETETVPYTEKSEQTKKDIKEMVENKESDAVKRPLTRKRSNSNASSKSKPTKEAAVDVRSETEKAQESDEIKTPVTRKRTQSNASKPEEKTPEDTPSRRVKTPTSTERRMIITRKVSREMGEGASSQLLDDSVAVTPKRKYNRTKRKNTDDNESDASGSSIVSTRTKLSEDTDSNTVRKGKKSELTVIPEIIEEESAYPDNIRLTQKQKSVQSSWLEPTPSSSRGRRRKSAASLISVASVASVASRSSLVSDLDEEDRPAFDVQPIDRISLLNKKDFEGPPDTDELLSDMSPESVASDTTSLKRAQRMSRAVSETKIVPARAARIGRRVASIDVAETSALGSPLSGAESPARGRRASFNRACEALLTPKGRRASADLRKSLDSPTGSDRDVSVAPATGKRGRPSRRVSNTSATKSDTSRSKKMPALEEETNKK